MKPLQTKYLLLALMLFTFAQAIAAQTTTFTYQGRLTDASTQANGTYDLGFALFDSATGGRQIGAAQTRAAVNVSNGVFTVQLDFGAAAFPGADHFLEIAVKRPADSAFTTLAPRQQVTSTPYAIRALNATNATNAAQLGGTAANQFVRTGDFRLSDARTPTEGSNDYIQNRSAGAQTTADFSISGTGAANIFAANIFNAGVQYNIGGNRALFTDGGGNTIAGSLAGESSSGNLNSFYGRTA